MKLSTFAVFAVTLSFLSGCASQPTVPDWVSGESAKYKSDQYLIGRGSADTQEEAKDRARADVAKVFQVAVVANTDDTQRSKSDSSGAVQFEEQASRHISTSTDQIISGIQIADMWKNPANGNVHVLAVLPRLQTATSLRQQIGSLDDAIRNYIEQSRREDDLFVKIAAANHALETQLEREGLQKNLQVVDITGRGIEPQWNSDKLKADLGDLLKRVSIAPRAAAGSPAGLEEIVAGALARAGFMPDTGDHPAYVLQARMNLNDLGLIDGWYWQRGNLEITLTETANNRVRGTKQWSIKGNAQNAAEAVQRAMDQADAILKRELGDAIVSMATARQE
jgi:hypothetical protein